jgi:hypothetical protein
MYARNNAQARLQAKIATADPAVASSNDEWNPENEKFVTDVALEGYTLFAVGFSVLAAFFIYFVVRCVCCAFLGDVRSLPI